MNRTVTAKKASDQPFFDRIEYIEEEVSLLAKGKCQTQSLTEQMWMVQREASLITQAVEDQGQALSNTIDFLLNIQPLQARSQINEILCGFLKPI